MPIPGRRPTRARRRLPAGAARRRSRRPGASPAAAASPARARSARRCAGSVTPAWSATVSRHDGAVAIVGDQRSRHRGAVAEMPGEVVLEDERAGRPRHVDDLPAPLRRQHAAGRIVEASAGSKQTRAPVLAKASASRSGRTPSASIGTGIGAQAGRAGGGHRAGIGRRLDEHGRGRARRWPGRPCDSALWPPLVTSTSSAVTSPPDIRGEQRAQRRQTGRRGAVPGVGPAGGARQGRGQRPRRLQRPRAGSRRPA